MHILITEIKNSINDINNKKGFHWNRDKWTGQSGKGFSQKMLAMNKKLENITELEALENKKYRYHCLCNRKSSRKKRKKKKRKALKEKITKDFSGLEKDERPQTERAHEVPNKIDTLKPIPRHITRTFQNMKAKL